MRDARDALRATGKPANVIGGAPPGAPASDIAPAKRAIGGVPGGSRLTHLERTPVTHSPPGAGHERVPPADATTKHAEAPVSAPLQTRIARLRRRLEESADVAHGEVRVVVSPYRICPIGAHVDHQGGPVLGTAIDAETLLAFAPSASARCRLETANFEGGYALGLGEDADAPEGWARYFWAAAATLGDRLRGSPRGIVGMLEGSLPGGGLSSSASVLLAYLRALAHANAIELSPHELIALSRRAENEHVGVKCGILDPGCIVASRRDHLVFIDTQEPRFDPIEGRHAARASVFLVAFSGVGRNLRHTGFNDRVDQCHEAARRLGALAGQPGVTRLGDLADAVFERHADGLPATLRRRARHFFEERRRVLAGAAAWREGDLAAFGRLMNDSCRSSIENFEVGSPEIVRLQRLIRETPGVYGARFSGAGFGGCVVALVDAGRADDCRDRIERAYAKETPALTAARVFLAHSRDGLHLR